jgi:S1-C subfamily serine protease
MMKTLMRLKSSILALSLLAHPFAGAAIIGNDDRVMAKHLEGEQTPTQFQGVQSAVKATAALIRSGKLQKNKKTGDYSLDSKSSHGSILILDTLRAYEVDFMSSDEKSRLFAQYTNYDSFCSDSNLIDQGAKYSPGVFCSAVLITPQHILTAAHCITELGPNEVVKVAFDYLENNQIYDSSQIYQFSSKDILDTEWRRGVYDYALIRLDRPVENREPVAVNLSENPQEGDKIFALGFPYGLPMVFNSGTVLKQAFNKKPEINNYTTIKADLDLFPGNSGGPTFDEKGVLLGINTDVTTPHLKLNKVSAKTGCFTWNTGDEEEFSSSTMPIKLIRERLLDILEHEE